MPLKVKFNFAKKPKPQPKSKVGKPKTKAKAKAKAKPKAVRDGSGMMKREVQANYKRRLQRKEKQSKSNRLR